MISVRRLFSTSSSCLAAFSTTSKATASSLTDLLTGSYDPLSKKKDDGQPRRSQPRTDSGPDQGYRQPSGAGQQARRQAVGLSQQRARESRDGPPQQRRDGQQQQRYQGPGRGRGRGRGVGRGPGFTQETSADAVWDDIPDVGEDVTANPDRRPRSERVPRRKPASMMSTISDDSAVFSGRSGRGGARGGGRGGGHGDGMQAAGRGRGRTGGRGRGRGRAGRGGDFAVQGRGRQQRGGPEAGAVEGEDESEGARAAAAGRVSHPEDGMGMEEEPDWHVAREDGTLAKLPLDKGGSAYTLDSDGTTIHDVWDSLDLAELRELLQFELSYSRADHEAWLRGPGREEMADARKEVGVDGFKDEAEFDAEVAMQMQMFDRYTWVDDLYFYYKHREADAGATADSMRLEHMASSLSGATAASAGAADAADATAEATAGAAEEAAASGDPGGDAAGEVEETRELTEEEVAAKAAERHEWMKGDVRRSMREARLLAKLIAIREKAPIGTAPRRGGSDFNRREFETLLTDKMMELVFPERPRAIDGAHLSERQAEDAQRAQFFEAHPETDVNAAVQMSLERPELFPATTEEQLSREWFEARMDLLRDEICHPLAGIHTDEEWAAFKDVVYDKVPELMEKRFKMHSDQGFSGLLGGFQEEQMFLNRIGSNVVPEEHFARPMLAVMTHRIANNPQWKWQEKVRAVHKLAHLLLRGDRHAQRTAGTP